MIFHTQTLAAALSFAVVAQAQYRIDPESVDINERDVWCQTQLVTCPMICLEVDTRDPITNDCDAETLTYGCLCGNNQQPNISEYSETLPYFVCREWTNQCVNDCDGDNTCAASCREDHPCGAQNPTRVNTTSTSVSPTASETDAFVSGGPDDPEDDDNAAAALVGMGQAYGMVVVLGSVFAGIVLL